MGEQPRAVPRFKVHYQQGSDARRRKELRAQRRLDGEIAGPRRAWKPGRKIAPAIKVDGPKESVWAKVAEQIGVDE